MFKAQNIFCFCGLFFLSVLLTLYKFQRAFKFWSMFLLYKKKQNFLIKELLDYNVMEELYFYIKTWTLNKRKKHIIIQCTYIYIIQLIGYQIMGIYIAANKIVVHIYIFHWFLGLFFSIKSAIFTENIVKTAQLTQWSK